MEVKLEVRAPPRRLDPSDRTQTRGAQKAARDRRQEELLASRKQRLQQERNREWLAGRTEKKAMVRRKKKEPPAQASESPAGELLKAASRT